MELKAGIGSLIRAERLKKNLRQVDCAEKGGFKQQALWARLEHIEGDKIRLDTAARVATALGVDLSFFQKKKLDRLSLKDYISIDRQLKFSEKGF